MQIEPKYIKSSQKRLILVLEDYYWFSKSKKIFIRVVPYYSLTYSSVLNTLII